LKAKYASAISTITSKKVRCMAHPRGAVRKI
jgi:hypothetical protein